MQKQNCRSDQRILRFHWERQQSRRALPQPDESKMVKGCKQKEADPLQPGGRVSTLTRTIHPQCHPESGKRHRALRLCTGRLPMRCRILMQRFRQCIIGKAHTYFGISNTPLWFVLGVQSSATTIFVLVDAFTIFTGPQR